MTDMGYTDNDVLEELEKAENPSEYAEALDNYSSLNLDDISETGIEAVGALLEGVSGDQNLKRDIESMMYSEIFQEDHDFYKDVLGNQSHQKREEVMEDSPSPTKTTSDHYEALSNHSYQARQRVMDGMEEPGSPGGDSDFERDCLIGVRTTD